MMADKPNRITVDLSQFPDLVVIYLGMRAKTPRGLRTLLSFGPKIQASVTAAPDGLLLHENLLYSLFPPHFGMRQYWRDFDSLERWAHDLPHKAWWRDYLRDRAGTGFGTRRTSATERWSPSISTCHLRVSPSLRRISRLAARCSPRVVAWV